MLEEKILGIKEKTQVVVLPEMFSTGFSMQPNLFAETMQGETVKWMKKIAAEKRVILTGSLMIEEDGNYYNRLIWMLPNGQLWAIMINVIALHLPMRTSITRQATKKQLHK